LIAAELELMHEQVIKHGDNTSDDDFDEEYKKQFAEEDDKDEEEYVGQVYDYKKSGASFKL
jgi:hypothetical protein